MQILDAHLYLGTQMSWSDVHVSWRQHFPFSNAVFKFDHVKQALSVIKSDGMKVFGRQLGNANRQAPLQKLVT